jgi:hypothetical protein
MNKEAYVRRQDAAKYAEKRLLIFFYCCYEH